MEHVMKSFHSVPGVVWTALVLFVMPAPAAQIVIGQVAPLTGFDATQGRAYGAGMRLLFTKVNQEGGSNRHTFELVQQDDGGRPEDTVRVSRQLMDEHKPMVLAGYFGNLNVSQLINDGPLERNRIKLVGYRSAEIRVETPRLYRDVSR